MADRYLLDTHVWLWWLADDPSLSRPARAVIGDGTHTILVSAASTWECMIKARLGKLRLPDEIESLVEHAEAEDGFSLLPVRHGHALRLHSLPPIHRDPFDRMLVAQAIEEQATLISADTALRTYPVPLLSA